MNSQIGLSDLQIRFEYKLELYLSSLVSSSPTIIEAISYSCLAKSKRLRPLLVYATGLSLKLDIELLDSAAIAIELMHTYSLIHDDLPAMDDDDLRRGQASSHKKFNDATAILTGDALQNLAIEVLLEEPLIESATKNKMAIFLLKASGYQGMIAGQCLDIELLKKPNLKLNTLQEIHLLKTACLLNACIKLPMQLATNIDMIYKKQLEQIGANLGLAFQIQDDYLDLYGNNEQLGKKQGSDLESNKKTFADFYKQDELKNLINQYYDQSKASLNTNESFLLIEIIDKLKKRQC